MRAIQKHCYGVLGACAEEIVSLLRDITSVGSHPFCALHIAFERWICGYF